MYLCKIYDLSSSSFVGFDAAEMVKQKEVMKQGVTVFFTKHGSSPQDSKRLMRILLLSALSLFESMAMEFSVSTSSSSTTSMFWWQLLCMVLMTALSIALGWIFYLKWQINALQGKCSKLSIDTKLYKVLDLLKGYKDKMLGQHENGEEENRESDPIVENPDATRDDVHTMVPGDAGSECPSIPHWLDPETLSWCMTPTQSCVLDMIDLKRCMKKLRLSRTKIRCILSKCQRSALSEICSSAGDALDVQHMSF